MFKEFINNFSTLIGISNTIIPDVITAIVIAILIYLTFKMDTTGLLSSVIIIALYTVTMAFLSLLGIDSVFNIITLLGDLL